MGEEVKEQRTDRRKIVITQELIDNAVKRSSSGCAIADAIKVAVPGATSIAIDVQTIRFSLPEKRIRQSYLTPRIAQLAIVRWDQGHMIEPFTFHLRRAHVTKMGMHPSSERGRKLSQARRQQLIEAGKMRANVVKPKNDEDLSKQRLKAVGFHVPLRVGGKQPPLNVPFARRRQFGLRALEF